MILTFAGDDIAMLSLSRELLLILYKTGAMECFKICLICIIPKENSGGTWEVEESCQFRVFHVAR